MKAFMRIVAVVALSVFSMELAAKEIIFEHNGIVYSTIDEDWFDGIEATTVKVINAAGRQGFENWYEHYQGAVNIPATVTYEGKTYTVAEIAEKAFMGQTGLTMVVIPKTVEVIRKQGFSGCVNLKSVAFASGGVLTSIGKEAFQSCAITGLNLPNSLKTMEDHAFMYCTRLKSVKGGDSVESFGTNCFGGCESLTEITFPKGLKKVGDFALANCSNLRTVTMNEGLEEIGNDAFLQCTSLDNVVIPNTVKTIGWEAFRYCLNLRSIVVPNSVESMDYGTFRYCTGLEEVTLSNKLKNIPAWCFEQVPLKRIEIPNSVTSIMPFAFMGCTALSEVKWSNSLEEIGAQSFLNTSLSKLVFPESLVHIGEFAFLQCENLQEVHIPRSVVSIYDGAFQECPILDLVYCYALTPPTMPHTNPPFALCDNPVKVHIYEGLREVYEESIGWSASIQDNVLILVDDMEPMKVESLSIDNAPIYCDIGDAGVATATIYPANAFNKDLLWSCSDESILYIDEFTGQYMAFGVGTATITATATDGSGASASALVYVTDGSGVEMIETDDAINTIYDLQGRRVKNPTKGIYVVNGKKVIY